MKFTCSTTRILRLCTRKMSSNVRSTTASGSQVYDTERAVNEYLLFHFGDKSNPNIQMPYDFGPRDALNFTSRTSNLCTSFHHNKTSNKRALDIGCSVGGSTFELSRNCNEVIGIDFSQHFIDAANDMKLKGEREYEIMKQGKIFMKCTASISPDIDRTKVSFFQGDACNLSTSLGKFDIIHASNLMCRLPSPRKFLSSIPHFLNDDGIFVLISPYSWLEEYTSLNEWVGACKDTTSGNEVDSFTCLNDYLKNQVGMQLVHKEDIPFLIREHERKFQYGVSDATIWKKCI